MNITIAEFIVYGLVCFSGGALAMFNWLLWVWDRRGGK